MTTNTLLHNIKQNQNKPADNAFYSYGQMYNNYENELFRNNFLMNQMNGTKCNPYYNQQFIQNDKFKNFKSKNNFKLGNNLFTKNKPKTIKSDQNLSMIKPIDAKSEISYSVPEQNNILLNIQIKTDNGLKSIELKKRDNISLIVEKFCIENKLNSNLVSPIHHYINKAITSIDEVLFKNNVNGNIVNKIKNIHDKLAESRESTYCEDVNLSCISAINEETDSESIEDILNRTL